MKRINHLYDQIISPENLGLADARARKGKLKSRGVMRHDLNRENNLVILHQSLVLGTYKTSPYDVFKMVTDNNKEREIFRLPYYPDRIMHHAILNVLEPIWVSMYTADTYSCIKGRGIHGAFFKLKRALLSDPEGTRYCLKLDIRKFYPSIDHDILKLIIRKKIKDNRLLKLLDEIIGSAPGVPIGNYLSQYMANLYLTYFDHWLKEDQKVAYYYRYCDDMVILHDDKNYLHALCDRIRDYLLTNLNLTLRSNYQVFPIESRGLDFLGYRFYHTHILLRKSLKKRFAKKVIRMKVRNAESLRTLQSAYWGWAKHCNSKNLLKKLVA